jgi:hypothetical protein
MDYEFEGTGSSIYFKDDFERRDAANKGDALKYYNLCVQGGFEPESEFKGLYNLGYEKFKQLHPENFINFDIQEEGEKYSTFANEVKKNNLNPEAVFKNPLVKAGLLKRVFGYTKLKGSKRSILNEEPVKIGKAFKGVCKKASGLGLL